MNKESNISKEYKTFKKYILTLDKEEIFDRAFEINFYTEIYNYIKYLDKESRKLYHIDSLEIWKLFNFYTDSDLYSIESQNNILMLINAYNKYRKENNEIR
ncbi:MULTISPECIES: hypothetical protein [Fusobacterium]|uniref:hypothetical protein n=1 Tax=Fusobacterium TaxID=848 RepID=UPI001476845F|nr:MULTISPECIES: hypothetical protein [Fusobacterium]NME35193.1 hypothetical protein [Fusobacterium sp. FSA-380-WT-3A]